MEIKRNSFLNYFLNFIFIYTTLISTAYYVKKIAGTWSWGFGSLLFIFPELIVGSIYMIVILTIMSLFDKKIKEDIKHAKR